MAIFGSLFFDGIGTLKKLYRQKYHVSAVLTMIGLAQKYVVLQPPLLCGHGLNPLNFAQWISFCTFYYIRGSELILKSYFHKIKTRFLCSNFIMNVLVKRRKFLGDIYRLTGKQTITSLAKCGQWRIAERLPIL